MHRADHADVERAPEHATAGQKYDPRPVASQLRKTPRKIPMSRVKIRRQQRIHRLRRRAQHSRTMTADLAQPRHAVTIRDAPVPLRSDVTQQRVALDRRIFPELRNLVAIQNRKSMPASFGDVHEDLSLRRLQCILEHRLLFRRNFVNRDRVNIGGTDFACSQAQHPFDFADEVGTDHFQAAVPPLLQPLTREARLDDIRQARFLA